jgi:tRNA A37 N6-isopentenylltransferase MiaA
MRLLTIQGATSSGKTAKAIEIAKQSHNPIIFLADSRQVYKELNILSGKDEVNITDAAEFDYIDASIGAIYTIQGVPYFGINVISISDSFNLVDFIELWSNTLMYIANDSTVILTGGSDLYINAIINEYSLRRSNIDVVNIQSVSETTWLSYYELYGNNSLNQSDSHNPRRIKRYYERLFEIDSGVKYPKFEMVANYIMSTSEDNIYSNIAKRVHDRLQNGMVKELYDLSMDYTLAKYFGLDIIVTWIYLYGWIAEDELPELLIKKEIDYAKRQMTWHNKYNLMKI